MVDLEDLAETTVSYAIKLGASDCDVLAADSKYTTAEIEKSSMKQSSQVRDPGVGIRAFRNGCAGFSFCTGHDPKTVRKVAGLAVSQAKAGTPDPDFKGLPEKMTPAKASGLFERKISMLEADDVVEMAISLSDRAGDDRRIASVNAGVTVAEGIFALANSNGFSSHQKMTTFEISAEAVARDGSEMFSGVDAGGSRKLSPEMIERTGDNAKEHAIMGLTSMKFQTGDYPVVMDPLAVGFVFGMAIGGGVNAESVQRKRSYLTGKLGKKIGSEKFTVLDDPTIAWATGSYSFDGEGVRARRKTVIGNGVLKTYLYDSYASGKDDVPSTGNSSRGGSIWSFRRPPSISPSNIVVRKGDSDLEEMIKETRRGVYLRLTYDYPNLATGEFSGLMMESFGIERGELGPSIKQATMGVHLTEMFSRVDLVGKKARDVFGVRTPALRISRARIGGSD